jgi:hypothetical protein
VSARSRATRRLVRVVDVPPGVVGWGVGPRPARLVGTAELDRTGPGLRRVTPSVACAQGWCTPPTSDRVRMPTRSTSTFPANDCPTSAGCDAARAGWTACWTRSIGRGGEPGAPADRHGRSESRSGRAADHRGWRSPVEVDVKPAQPEQLGTPHAGHHGQPHERAQPASRSHAASTSCAACCGVGGCGSGAGFRGLRATWPRWT